MEINNENIVEETAKEQMPFFFKTPGLIIAFILGGLITVLLFWTGKNKYDQNDEKYKTWNTAGIIFMIVINIIVMSFLL